MYVTKIEPRVSETDGAGHINNTTIPIWFEAGRNEIFRLFTPDLSFKNWKLVLANMNVDFVRELYYGKEVKIHTWIGRIGNSSFVVKEEIYQEDMLCARGTATYVNYDLKRKQSQPIPDEIRDILQTHMMEN
ncbi:acyl-CoA thioesterase [Peribacillus sp. SCS-155]|uniref:acyl-CoA thioesterase n=1 Tax=Peribacillus sedimenti TaxID=3115297 RepID=UPI003905CA8B